MRQFYCCRTDFRSPIVGAADRGPTAGLKEPKTHVVSRARGAGAGHRRMTGAPDAPLDVADPVPAAAFVDTAGHRADLRNDYFAGHRTVLLVARSPRGTLALELSKIAGRLRAFSALGVRCAAWTAAPPQENAAVAQQLRVDMMMLSEEGFGLGRALGLETADGLKTLVVGPDLRVERVLEGAGQIEAALRHCEACAGAEAPFAEPRHAPVLVIERILEPEQCARLIAYHQGATPVQGFVVSRAQGRNVVSTQTKVRKDVPLPDLDPLTQEVFAALRRRVLPDVRRAFAFAISRAETLRLGCYAAEEGGRFRAHRDDIGQVPHRRFALSLNLNTGAYEGGALRFPEYGPGLYAPPAGGGIVFSCALLHEALPVTSGRRYGLFGFFWGEEEEAGRPAAASRPAARIDRPPET